ncbi:MULTISPECIES: hypothetical protein [Cellulomonas]|uniref:Uncharacterized protein n=1 Tax=Cellulomonas gilvus (strain ATCC 13127 / NRRL B-14078) TaxID=593907 RepID=F8A4C3_CELGA|nr:MULTISPECIES: hypothetical protein [Cellulomonas]AEI12029.1 hypothetical protein Celgi_1510 [Cellulomonas gilvus ATCC 13127]MCR6690194.1 hypothetical protein [Cellulomonas sp.]
MYLSPPPLSLLHSRQATLQQSRSALPDAPVVPDAPRRRLRRPARPVVAVRLSGARTLHRLADALAPSERTAILR